MKKILEIIIKVVIGLIVIFMILWLLFNYFWNKVYDLNDVIWVCENSEYVIWKKIWNKEYSFCDTKKTLNCIEWEILSTIKNEDTLFLHFNLNKFSSMTNVEINEKISRLDNPLGYIYRIFSNDFDNDFYAKSYNDIYKFLELDNSCKITLYSQNDLEKLSENKKNLFNELEKKSTIMINGIDYSK